MNMELILSDLSRLPGILEFLAKDNPAHVQLSLTLNKEGWHAEIVQEIEPSSA
jgi:hypothetical protein